MDKPIVQDMLGLHGPRCPEFCVCNGTADMDTVRVDLSQFRQQAMSPEEFESFKRDFLLRQSQPPTVLGSLTGILYIHPPAPTLRALVRHWWRRIRGRA